MKLSASTLVLMAATINRVAGTPQEPFSAHEGRGVYANVGCFHVTNPYRGKHALECIENDVGGTRTVIPACTKVEMYHRMLAFIAGMEEGKLR